MTVIEYPVMTLLVCEDLSIVPRAVEVIVFIRADDCGGIALMHRTSLAVYKHSVKCLAATDLYLVCLVPILSGTDEEVPPALAIVQVCAFEDTVALGVL